MAFTIDVDVTVATFSEDGTPILLLAEGNSPGNLFVCDDNSSHRCLITPDGLTLDYDHCITFIGFPPEVCIEGKGAIDDYNKNLLAVQLEAARNEKIEIEKETVPELTEALKNLNVNVSTQQAASDDVWNQVLWGLGILASLFVLVWANKKRVASQSVQPTMDQELGVILPDKRVDRLRVEIPPVAKGDDTSEFMDEFNDFVSAKEEVEVKKINKTKPLEVLKDKLVGFKEAADQAIKNVKPKKELDESELPENAS